MKTNATHIAARYTDTLESLQLSARDVTAIEHVTPGSRRILIYTTTRETPIRAYDLDRDDSLYGDTMRTTFLRKDITKDQGVALLKAANHAVSNPDLSPEDRAAALKVVEQIAYDISAIFGADAADVVEAAFGFAIVPGTQRHV